MYVRETVVPSYRRGPPGVQPGPAIHNTAPPHSTSAGHSEARSVTLASTLERGPFLWEEKAVGRTVVILRMTLGI